MKKQGKNALEILLDLSANRQTSALVLAAGNSTRMKITGSKQFLEIGGVPVLARTLLAYENAKTVKEIIVAARAEDFDAILKIAKDYHITKFRALVRGGKSRQESAENALRRVHEKSRYVCVADGARCLVTPAEIDAVNLAAYKTNAASAGTIVSDTVKRATVLGAVKETIDRNGLWTVQTPQSFHIALYASAVKHAREDGFSGTDDNSLVEHLGYRVHLVPCKKENIKITTQEDIALAEAIVAYRNAKKEGAT